MHKIILSAPFGNYLRFANTTPTIGTFTVQRRGSVLDRVWRALRTIRYYWREQAWVNRMGLLNPGFESIPSTEGKILSICGFAEWEWTLLATYAQWVEFNLSCPNVAHQPCIHECEPAIRLALNLGRTVICKLPPIDWMGWGRPLFALGVRYFHLCNTIPTRNGGMSGKPLLPLSLRAVAEFRQEFGNEVTLIGGGGVTSVEDVQRYLAAGADHMAIGSMLLNPLNWLKVKKLVGLFPDRR